MEITELIDIMIKEGSLSEQDGKECNQLLENEGLD